jgi:hypothetical protein
MTMMEICSDQEDQQTSKMHEASLLVLRVWKAGSNVHLGFGKPNMSFGGDDGPNTSLLGRKENSLDTNGPFALLARCPNEAPNAPSTLFPESRFSKRKYATAASKDPAPTSVLPRCQAQVAMGNQAKNAFNGHLRQAPNERLQRKAQRKQPGLLATPPTLRFFPKSLLLFPAF